MSTLIYYMIAFKILSFDIHHSEDLKYVIYNGDDLSHFIKSDSTFMRFKFDTLGRKILEEYVFNHSRLRINYSYPSISDALLGETWVMNYDTMLNYTYNYYKVGDTSFLTRNDSYTEKSFSVNKGYILRCSRTCGQVLSESSGNTIPDMAALKKYWCGLSIDSTVYRKHGFIKYRSSEEISGTYLLGTNISAIYKNSFGSPKFLFSGADDKIIEIRDAIYTIKIYFDENIPKEIVFYGKESGEKKLYFSLEKP